MTEETPNSTGDKAGAANDQQQTTEQPKERSFTQADVNAAQAEEKRKWQAQVKELKTKADEWDKMQEASKSELEKLQGQNKVLSDDNTSIKTELMRLRLAVEAQIPADKLPKVLKYISGSTVEEITASLAEIKADWGLNSQSKTGAGSNPANPAEQNKAKIWKTSEIANMSSDEHIKNKDEILLAMSEGRVIEG